VHDVVLMLEMGDRREGVSPEELMPLAATAMREPSLRLAGIGANFMCASGVLPTIEKLQRLARLADEVEQRFGVALDYVSGGNSSNLALMEMEGVELPARINNLRIGSAILRGENSITGGVLAGYDDDAFTLEAELVEIKTKHSLPDGETGPDAFGNRLVFEDRGARLRGIVNLGRADIRPEGLRPRHRGVEVVTASSDHLILDITGAKTFAVGDGMRFEMDYGALLQSMLSPYIDKTLAGREAIAPRPTALRLIAPAGIHERRGDPRLPRPGRRARPRAAPRRRARGRRPAAVGRARPRRHPRAPRHRRRRRRWRTGCCGSIRSRATSRRSPRSGDHGAVRPTPGEPRAGAHHRGARHPGS
jgi:hypothetical protein